MESDYRVYLRVENRPDLLSKAIDSIKEFWPVLTILDNTPEGIIRKEEWTEMGFRKLLFTRSHKDC